MTVSAARLLDTFSKEAGKGQVLAPPDTPGPEEHPDAVTETAKALARVAIYDAYTSSTEKFNDFTFQLKPERSVFLSKDVNKRDLVLVPFTTIVSVSTKPPKAPSVFIAEPIFVAKNQEKFYATFMKRDVPPKDHGERRPPHESKTPHAFMVPFWCVRKVAVAADANMMPSTVTTKGGVVIPTLVPKKALSAGVELTVHAPPPSAKPLTLAAPGAPSQSGPKRPASSAKAPAAKKARGR